MIALFHQSEIFPKRFNHFRDPHQWQTYTVQWLDFICLAGSPHPFTKHSCTHWVCKLVAAILAQ